MIGTKEKVRASALVSVVSMSVLLTGLVFATTAFSVVDLKQSRNALEKVRARYVAEAGVEDAVAFLRSAVKKTSFHDPLLGLHNLFKSGGTVRFKIGQALMDGGKKMGEYSVTMTGASDKKGMTVTIRSTGYLPAAPQNLPPGKRAGSWQALEVAVRFETGPSRVFDYGYFINNWGWFYGSSIVCHGNARSNGQFDAAGYAPTVTGQPIYDRVAWIGGKAVLSGYHDDNGDGLRDGKDGGIYSGWDIVRVKSVRGLGGKPSNQHDFQDSVPMPNLTDLSQYEEKAKAEGGYVAIGKKRVLDAVAGDDFGERENVYLRGTKDNPIRIHGKVIIRGNVIISGWITGRGAIYAGGNIYIPRSLRYVNPPSSPRPDSNSKEDTEKWLTKNWDKDFIGFFARENIAVGNIEDSTWRHYVNRWMTSSMNRSDEDAGQDGVPNTKAGKDGKKGTADDDVLEDDNVFTVEHYTSLDAKLGLIPPGKSVGDPIPGTGEDIDGDGVYDPATSLKGDIDFKVPLDKWHWGGNMPFLGLKSYSDVATVQAHHLDGVFYTNHSFCWYVHNSKDAVINGALVSRNEDIIYGTPHLVFNFDCRLLGGGAGPVKKFLPRTVRPVRFLRWELLSRDPNRYVVKP